MKKTISILLAVCLVLSLAGTSAYASTSALSSAQQVVQALGIITGDENGNLNLSDNVTRAQFAKMMIAASSYKDTISTTAKSSPFKDVMYTHWAASYVQAAVTAGWLTGYTDGTYRPNNNLTLEEAVSAVLKMLGYTSSDFIGSFPEAQIAKYNALGLNDGITAVQGTLLTRQDCVNLFYNLMSTKNKSGSYYATTLGYTVNSSGEIALSSLVLANMSGPYVVEDSAWSTNLPFSSSAAAIYRNGSASSVSAVSLYDVYYYNSGMKTVWVYSNRVSGVYTAASPSTSAPTSVTVAGNTYSITSSAAAYALSDMGLYGIGDSVTLLLGMNGDVVSVVDASSLNSTFYGIVTATGISSYTDSSGSSYSSNTITVYCTDGNSYQFEVSSSSYSTGAIIKVEYSNGKANISGLSETTLSGVVNSSATTLGSYKLADDVHILDTTSNGSYVKVYASRLAGLSLSTSQIRYFALDSNGDISDLILNDVTGDMYEYGILTSVSESFSTSNISLSSSYEFLIDGSSASYNSTSIAFNVTTGPALFERSGNSVSAIKNLSKVSFTSINTAYGTDSSGTQYKFSDGVSVYIYSSGTYYQSTLSTVLDSSSYTLRGYYYKVPSSGGRIRVIIAYAS